MITKKSTDNERQPAVTSVEPGQGCLKFYGKPMMMHSQRTSRRTEPSKQIHSTPKIPPPEQKTATWLDFVSHQCFGRHSQSLPGSSDCVKLPNPKSIPQKPVEMPLSAFEFRTSPLNTDLLQIHPPNPQQAHVWRSE
jgi:hypothetical protein